ARTPRVVIVNETLSRRYFGGNALGQRLKWGGPRNTEPWMTIVGVIEDVKQDRLDGDPRPAIYMPVLQADSATIPMYRFLSYAVRMARPGPVPMNALRQAVHDVDPLLAILSATPMDAIVGQSIAGRRFNALLLGLFSGLALILAATGVYG